MMVVSGIAVVLGVIVCLLLVRMYENKERYDVLRYVDDITGLQNVRALYKNLEHYVNKNVIIDIIDIDDFKFYDDTMERTAGNRVLSKIAMELRKLARYEDCYQFGDDQFLIITSGIHSDELEDRLESLRSAVAQLDVDENHANITCSQGYTFGRVENIFDVDTMIRFASRKVYEAKNAGKNRVCGSAYEKRNFHDSLRDRLVKVHKTEEVDSVTGMLNLSTFLSRAEKLISMAKAQDVAVAMLYFEIEDFRKINDQYGVGRADAALKGTAEKMQSEFDGFLTGRFSEDAFLVLCYDDHLIDRIESLRQSLRDIIPGAKLEIKTGIFISPVSAMQAGSAVDKARTAAESIQHVYDIWYKYYDAELERKIKWQEYIVHNFDAALDQGRIIVYYQPIVRTFTSMLCGLEALVRWDDPEYGFLTPDRFISELEQFHLIHRLDSYIIHTVCQNYRMYNKDAFRNIPISVNLSPLDFELCDIDQIISHAVAVNGMPKELLHFEITEEAVERQRGLLLEKVHTLQRNGFAIWLDDFGTRYFGINLLREQIFDTVKIGHHFLETFDDKAKIIIADFVNTTRKMGVKTLVKGVENKEQFEFLKDIGCAKVQGFLFGRPLSIAEIDDAISGGVFEVEPLDMKPYMNMIGRLNLMAPAPCKELPDFTGVSWAVLERDENGDVRHLAANPEYMKELKKTGYDSFDSIETVIRTDSWPAVSKFRDMITQAAKSGQVEQMNFIEQGNYCTVRSCRIASYGTKTALLHSLTNFQISALSTRNELLEYSINELYNRFCRVDFFHVEEDLMEPVYVSAHHGGVTTKVKASPAIESYCRDHIYKADQERFRAFHDVQTVEERLKASKIGQLCDFFRAVLPDGNLLWQMYVISPGSRSNLHILLGTCNDLPDNVCRLLDSMYGGQTQNEPAG